MTVVGVAARCRPDVSYDRSECRKASTTDATRGRMFAIERIYADPHRWRLTVAATPPDAQSYIIAITLPVLLASRTWRAVPAIEVRRTLRRDCQCSENNQNATVKRQFHN
jgi:hypothetical protein